MSYWYITAFILMKLSAFIIILSSRSHGWVLTVDKRHMAFFVKWFLSYIVSSGDVQAHVFSVSEYKRIVHKKLPLFCVHSICTMTDSP